MEVSAKKEIVAVEISLSRDEIVGVREALDHYRTCQNVRKPESHILVIDTLLCKIKKAIG